MEAEDAPVASTSKLSLEDVTATSEPTSRRSTNGTLTGIAIGDGKAEEGGATREMPTLAQLLEETVRLNGTRKNGAASLPSLPTLGTPQSRTYISQLLSKDLPSLLREPEELSKQSDLLDSDLANLCYRSTRDLLSVGECVETVENGFGQVQDTLDGLLACTEQLSATCATFSTTIDPILSSRSRLNLVRSHITSIEDILSIPRLVSTCVRGGWWGEAMELAYRARELEHILQRRDGKASTRSRSSSGSVINNNTDGATRPSKAPSDKDLLSRVVRDVELEMRSLRARIIDSLRARALKLPAAVKSIGLLRRMTDFSTARPSVSQVGNEPIATTPTNDEGSKAQADESLSEPELRLTFLVSRWDCLRSQLEQLEAAAVGSSQDEEMRYIKKWVEVWREIVGETVNVYTEIFLGSSSNETGAHPPALLSPSIERNVRSQRTGGSDEEDHPSPSPLHLVRPQTPFVIFLRQALGSLEQMLVRQLGHITSVPSIATLQTQLAYCSTAFAKFGFDFQSLPNQLITARIEQITLERFSAASEMFEKDLQRARTMSGARAGKSRLVVNALIAAEGRQTVLKLDLDSLCARSASKVVMTSQPAASIALFPPLAKLVNAHASALNELRLLPLVSLYPSLRAAQMRALLDVIRTVHSYWEAAQSVWQSAQSSGYLDDETTSASSEETDIVLRFIATLSSLVVPWCRWALSEGVYPDVSRLEAEDHLEASDAEVALEHALKRLLDECDLTPRVPDVTPLSSASEADAKASSSQPVQNGEVAEAPAQNGPNDGEQKEPDDSGHMQVVHSSDDAGQEDSPHTVAHEGSTQETLTEARDVVEHSTNQQ